MNKREILEILLEKNVTGDLYHMTSGTGDAIKILQNGFNLSPSVGADDLFKEDYYLSVSRSPVNDYRSIGRNPTFVIDKSVQNNHKVRSIDYWGMRKIKSESEERILSNKDTLSTSFIKELHILERDIKNPNYLISLYDISRKTKIPVWVYPDETDQYKAVKGKRSIEKTEKERNVDSWGGGSSFFQLNKKGAKLLSEMDIDYDDENYDPKLARELRRDHVLEGMTRALNQLETKFKDKRYLDEWGGGFNLEEEYANIEGVLSSAKRSRNPEVRMKLREYMDFIKRNKYSGLKDALIKIAIKFHNYENDSHMITKLKNAKHLR